MRRHVMKQVELSGLDHSKSYDTMDEHGRLVPPGGAVAAPAVVETVEQAEPRVELTDGTASSVEVETAPSVEPGVTADPPAPVEPLKVKGPYRKPPGRKPKADAPQAGQ